MSEIKRATLSAPKAEDKKPKEVGKTVRISFILPESNEDTCPEYNYKELLAAAKRKDKEKIKPVKPVTNGLDPFNDDDDDVRRIAQEMEAKYGVSGPKKRRKGRRDDYADIGMGYDESDSFIDNTDGYDEMIPENVTTLHGGFYINCGALEFKACFDMSSSSSDDEVQSTSRKRALESSSESEGEKETDNCTDLVDKKPKLYPNVTNGIPKFDTIIKSEKIKQLKKKRTDEKKKHPTVKDLLKEKREDVNGIVLDEEPIEEIANDEEPKDSMKENKKPMSLHNISDVIESVVKGVDDEIKTIADMLNKCESNDAKTSTAPLSDGKNSKDSENLKKIDEIIKLPENLPEDIVNVISKIKEYASKNTEGKVKFFTGPVKDVLLSLERKCKCLGKQSRMKIYEHLAPFMKCRKETLIGRAKNLVLEDDHKILKSLQKKLKDEIERAMPSLLDNYEKEGQRIMQKKFSKESAINEENKHLRMPKRLFHWTEEIKKTLKEIVTLRKRCFLLEGINKDHLENLMNSFLKTEIHVLWPEGWMSMSSLQKVCNNVLMSDGKKPAASAKNTHVTSSNATVDTTTKEMHKISSNSNLSIIPVCANLKKSVSVNVDTSKSRTISKSDITINKIDNKEVSVSKTIKTLPEATKTSNALIITPANTSSKPAVEKMERIDFIKSNVGNDTIIVDDSHVRSKSDQDTNNKQGMLEIKSQAESVPAVFDVGKTNNESNHCQIIDLTEQSSEVKKKSNHKNKTKLYDGDKGLKCKTVNEINKPKQLDKDELTGSLALNHLITESLNDTNKLPQNFTKQLAPITVDTTQKHFNPSSSYSTSAIEYQKLKSTNEGDDIQKVMENLKALEKLSSPVKTSESLMSSPVSVIAYNKNYSPKSHSSLSQSPSTVQHRKEYTKGDCSGFQEAFQRQLLNDFAFMQNSINHSTPTSSKSHYNSSDKCSLTSAPFLNEKYYQASNNNYTQQNSGKMKNLPPQPPGSYSILDDMLANFLTEYGYPKTANHIGKPPPK